MKSLIATLTLSLGLAAANAAQASLVDRGGGLIYDHDLNHLAGERQRQWSDDLE